MSVVRSLLGWTVGAALLLVLAGGVLWYGVVVPHQRAQRYHAAPDPTPTASDATATTVDTAPPTPGAHPVTATATPTASPGPTGTGGVVYDFVPTVGQCYETHAAGSDDADVTPTARNCNGPHNTLAVGLHRLPEPPGAAYSATAVVAEAQSLCTAEQQAVIGADGSRFTEVTIYPDADVWAAGGRDVGCLVRRDAGDVSGALTQ